MNCCLPTSLDGVAGLRAARWFRECTAGQYDNFGPDAQREQQDRAIERYGLVDTGLEWSVAASGWTSAWRTPAWEAMLGAARAGAFDLLVVGYVSPLPAQPQADAHRGRGPPRSRGRRRPLRRRAAPDERSRPLGPVRPRGPRGRGLQPQAVQARQRGLRAKRRRLGRPGWQPDALRPRPGGQPSVLRVDEEKAAVVRPRLRARRHRLDRLGGGGGTRASPRPTSARSSRTPSTPGGSGPARPRPSRPSSTRRSGRASRRRGSDGARGRRAAS